ncbi:MAG: hypothetical protein Q9163_002953 [Psora crenata]
MSLLNFADLIVIKCSERSMDIIHEEEPVSMDVTLALIPEIPPIKYHDGPLQFLSKPQLTQKQYERRVLDRRINPANEHENDTLTIRCPDGEQPRARIFKIRRQTLARSPTFAKFFSSAYYLPNSDMLVSFMNDPAAVFDIVKRYLEQGPELFDSTRLRVHVLRRYKALERTVVLIRLCRMADNMGLWYLHQMALKILVDENCSITAPMLPTIASLIFASEANYCHHLREWCLLQASHHFATLKDTGDWARSLATSDDELRKGWKIMVDQHKLEPGMLEDKVDGEVLEGRVHRITLQEYRRAISTTTGTEPTEKTPNYLKNEAPRMEAESDLEDWEDITAIGTPSLDEEDATSTETKTGPMLDTTASISALRRTANAETAKARLVMGIDNGFRSGSNEGRKAKGRKSRIISMLH